MEKNWPKTNGGRHKNEEVEMDRSYLRVRKPKESITRQALTWNPQGKRKKKRPRNTWRRDVERETTEMGFSWGEVSQLSQWLSEV